MSLLLKCILDVICLPEQNILVWVSLTIIWLLKQNFSRPFKGFTSPHENQKRGLDRPPIIYEQGFRLRWRLHVGCLSILPKWAKYLRNIRSLDIRPWIIPVWFWIAGLNWPWRLTRPKIAFAVQAPECVRNTRFPPTNHQLIKQYILIDYTKNFWEIHKTHE